MANKIDKIQVGTVSYEINLPSTATPSITSLTVTGGLTVSGTANLSFIELDGGAVIIGADQEGSLRFANEDGRSYAFQTDADTESLIIEPPNVISRRSGPAQYSHTFPDKSGTLALTSDIPTVPTITQGAWLDILDWTTQTSGYFTQRPSVEVKKNGTVIYHSSPFYPSTDTGVILFQTTCYHHHKI